jgi:hypothetical protein
LDVSIGSERKYVLVWKYGEYGGVGGSGDLDIVGLIMESLTISIFSRFMILYLLRTVEE